MASLSSVELDQEKKEELSRSSSGPVGSQGQAQAWEISFGNDKDPKKPVLPKFLRDREQARLSSSTNINRQPSRSSTSPPLKGKDIKSVSNPPSKSNTSPSRHKNHAKRRDLSQSPKKSPAIKEPLLPMTSPTKKSASTADIKSRSDCSLTPRATSAISMDRGSATKKPRPQSAMPSLGVGNRSEKPQSASTRNEGRPDDTTEMLRPSRSCIPTVNLESSSPKSKLATKPSEMAQRKVLDLRRWYCMCHPQYSMSCGISSVVSCWNYLFSTLGTGRLPPLTQEEALTILGFHPPFGSIKFGPFTGNVTVMRWFQNMCSHFGVTGQAYYFYKPVGRRRTVGIKPSMALERLQEGLRSTDMTFVYHCTNHYFCPIGYEQVPKNPTDAYRIDLGPHDVSTMVLIGEPSRKQPAIHCKKWEDIVKDLTCETPHTFNIRRVREGILTKRIKRKGGNIHCIIALKKIHETTYNVDSSFRFGTDEYDGETEVTPSEVEDLDSADSDYPESQEGDNTSSHNLRTMDLDSINVLETVSTDSTLVSQPIGTFTSDMTHPVAISVRRRGTFTKEGPDVPIKLTRTASSDSDDSVETSSTVSQPIETIASDTTHPVAVNVQRRGTFTKERPTVPIKLTRTASSDSDGSVSSGGDTSGLPHDREGNSGSRSGSSDSIELPQGISRMKRSGTFTKHGPSDIQRPQGWTSDDNSDTSANPDQDANSRTITGEESSAVQDSGTSSFESEFALRREGTYTVVTPSDDFLDPQADEDLDKTLKASDFEDSA